MFGLDGLKYELYQHRFCRIVKSSKVFLRHHIFLEVFSTHAYTQRRLIENNLSCICKNMLSVCFDLFHSTSGCLHSTKTQQEAVGKHGLFLLTHSHQFSDLNSTCVVRVQSKLLKHCGLNLIVFFSSPHIISPVFEDGYMAVIHDQ